MPTVLPPSDYREKLSRGKSASSSLAWQHVWQGPEGWMLPSKLHQGGYSPWELTFKCRVQYFQHTIDARAKKGNPQVWNQKWGGWKRESMWSNSWELRNKTTSFFSLIKRRRDTREKEAGIKYVLYSSHQARHTPKASNGTREPSFKQKNS